MTEFWVARDKSGETFGFRQEPTLHEDGMWDDGNLAFMAVIPDSWFPDIKPGECRKFVMV